MLSNGITHRKKGEEPVLEDVKPAGNQIDLSLMEEIYLLGLSSNGNQSFFNTSLSHVLRPCILIELAIKGRIALEENKIRKKRLPNRLVMLQNEMPTDDPILNETLKLISKNTGQSLSQWIDLLNGESWNIWKLGFHVKNLRERIAKGLVEKGVLVIQKDVFFMIEYITYPIINHTVKLGVKKKVCNMLLEGWNSDIKRLDQRVVALVYLAYFAEVLESCLEDLSNDQYALANDRVEQLLSVDVELESLRSYTTDVFWGIVYAYLK